MVIMSLPAVKPTCKANDQTHRMQPMQAAVAPIHPFPARMAPEVALVQFESLPRSARVLDPLCGSGTVLRVAAESGRQAIGFDLDPLAVLMAKVWTTPIDTSGLRSAADALLKEAAAMSVAAARLPWLDDDPDTRAYVDYWFAEPQRSDLRRLAAALRGVGGATGDALRIALSRIIITKDHGASLARDVSHSRPHRVRTGNDFPVFPGFARSVGRLAERLETQPPPGRVRVSQGDARSLASLPSESVDAVVTSPPYLNAIDYLRGHRLSLVWLGYRIHELRNLRSQSIGTECGLAAHASWSLADELSQPLGSLDGLPSAERGMVKRYVLDLHALVEEIHRVVRPGGRVVFVVGNSCLRGVFIRNAELLTYIAERAGFVLLSNTERALPPNRRYLPPPGQFSPNDLRKRMRTETVLTLRRA